ncbi:MAG TPA: glutamine-hydrolyzing carbamoyl-phosphate synthase small subunit [Candidatus Eisenbacteria bacterium]|jgi:carbamoyl-phosphate synthase small subunit
MTDALLALEDGRVFRGRRFGALKDAAGEVVFNTSMTGYQEILGDPSYAGQIVVMTYPMIGNYGITPEDFESRKPFAEALVVREPSRIASNWRHERTLDDYLAAHGVPGLCDFDTRALVRHLRDHGSKRGVIADAAAGAEALVARARAVPQMAGCDLASSVTTSASYPWVRPSYRLPANGRGAAPAAAQGPDARRRVVVLDCGVKWNILRRLVDVGCDVTALPATTGAADVLALEPDGVVISNGPGDPEPVRYAVETVRGLIGRVPLMGICLGHQLLGLACGGRTYKLKFGHRGGNHPVMDLTTRKVEITSHNHGFAVDPDSLPDREVEITHINLNDQTLEGLRLRNHPAFGVQYHPEASPGPHDARYLFERFAAMMREHAPGAA